MKSKIVALSKNEEFKTLLKQKKISNKYVTIFFVFSMNLLILMLNLLFAILIITNIKGQKIIKNYIKSNYEKNLSTLK